MDGSVLGVLTSYLHNTVAVLLGLLAQTVEQNTNADNNLHQFNAVVEVSSASIDSFLSVIGIYRLLLSSISWPRSAQRIRNDSHAT